ncbi:hypothetical protein KSP39_PZI004391 [Platanthera zijinensis]|uniref:DUF632 domain-containing protein n=1 Tax=Platanthera zijinensis TaxID=2320716 RepID=A0AAP0GDG9_9ASPA
MGCCHSRLEGKEAISRCKARRRYMRQLSEGRQAFAAAHSLYLHFLRSTGAALLQISNAEAQLQQWPPSPSPHLPSPSTHSPSPPSPPLTNCELTREEKEKRLNLLRRQEANGADYFKVEKNKREIERLESKLMVSCQAIETTSIEIVRLREAELFPQLLDLINGLMCMWRVMYECHQVQTHIVQQLSYLNSPSTTTSPTSDLHRQATLQLESEIENWHSAFCSLIKSQRDYIHALAGWLRLSLFQCPHNQLEKNRLNSEIFALCEEWQLALDRVPDKVASEGIKSFLNVIHAVVVQQADEHRQKKRSDSAFKELEKRSKELRSLENRYGPYSSKEKKAKVDALKMKADEEKNKYEKSSGITRAMTLNNLQTGFPNLFQAMTGFSSVFVQAYSSVYNHRMSSALPLTSIEF